MLKGNTPLFLVCACVSVLDAVVRYGRKCIKNWENALEKVCVIVIVCVCVCVCVMFVKGMGSYFCLLVCLYPSYTLCFDKFMRRICFVVPLIYVALSAYLSVLEVCTSDCLRGTVLAEMAVSVGQSRGIFCARKVQIPFDF